MKVILFVLSLLLIPNFVHAQSDPPWPPDPDEIFAPGIEVTVSEDNPYTWNDTRPHINDTEHTVEVYDVDAETFRSFPFPEGVQTLYIVESRTDGTLILASTPEQYLVLDPKTGEYTHPDLVCGVVPPLPDKENTWVFYTDPQIGRTSVCNSATGESVALVPHNHIVFWITSSLDGAWVVWAAFHTGTGTIDVYANEGTTRTQNYLGSYRPWDDYSRLEQWVDDRHGIIENSAMPESGAKDLLIFDVTEPESLKFAFTARSDYYPEPPQYRYLRVSYLMRYYEEVGEGHVCVLSIYYPLNGETVDHELAYACGNIFAPNDNEYVYLGFNLDGTSSLYRFNAASGEQTEYFRGELESLDSISPDGRYAVVVTDNSGQVDTVDLEPYPHNLRVFRDYPEAKLQVFDMETHQFVYEESGSKVSRIEWANTSTMLVASAEASNQPYNLQMVTFGVESTEIKQIPNLALYGLGSEIVRDGHYVFVWTEDDQGVKGMSAFDLNTNQLVPLVLNMLPPNYEVEIGGLVFDKLDIVVRLKNAPSSPADAQSIHYTLTLP